MDVTDPPPAPARHDASACHRINQILGRIGEKWTVRILIALGERGHRFGELRRGLDGISHRMLTLTLRHMERDGLVVRTVTPTIPPRVDYELTELGRSLAVQVRGLGEWAFSHADRIGEAQARYDARAQGIEAVGSGGGAVPA